MGRVDNAISARPKQGEVVSGDVAAVRMVDGFAVAGIADVLGHGASAYAVAKPIGEFMRNEATPDTVDTLTRLDGMLRGTVGAAVAFCSIELSSGHVSYSGVGNVTVRCMFAGRTAGHEFVPRDGIVGDSGVRHRINARACSTLELDGDTTLLLYTDGIRSSLRHHDHPGLASSDVTTVARTVVEQFGRNYDDAACLALRYVP